MRSSRKPPSRVSTPPTLSLSLVILGVAAVLAAAGALARHYARGRAVLRSAPETGVEIPAPDLEPLPASSAGPTTQ